MGMLKKRVVGRLFDKGNKVMWKVYLANAIFPGLDEFVFGSRFMGAVMMLLNAGSLGLAFMLAREFNGSLGVSLMVMICAVNTFRVYKDWEYK